jgi:hypothetical protein
MTQKETLQSKKSKQYLHSMLSLYDSMVMGLSQRPNYSTEPVVVIKRRKVLL